MRLGSAVQGIARRCLPSPVRGAIQLYRRVGDEAPALIDLPPGDRVLVLAPHMDDEVIGCGGTLVKHAERGCAITVAVLTDGSLGDPVAEAKAMPQAARDEMRKVLSEVRKNESRAAARVLGVEEVRFLGFIDGGLAQAPGAQETVQRLVADCRPDMLYAPFVTDRHPDHRATASLAAVLGRRWPDLLIVGYEVWSPLSCATWMVDITAQVERKRQALECYASQLVHNDYRHTSLGLNAYRTMFLGGRGFVEAFFAVPARAYAVMARAVG